MKELKFRAWDGKKMIEGVIPVSETDIVELFEYEHQVTEVEAVEQYTGLKDKNGQKIYEGDIVTFLVERFNNVTLGFESEDWHTAVVEWNQDDACYSFMVRDVPFSVRYEAEVIGNIHENQELLEIKNEI